MGSGVCRWARSAVRVGGNIPNVPNTGMGHFGAETHRVTCSRCEAWGWQCSLARWLGQGGLQLCFEGFEKIIGHFFRNAIDQARAHLGQFATNLCLGVVGQPGSLGHRFQAHAGGAFAKPHRAALTLEVHHARLGWVRLGHDERALKARSEWSNGGLDDDFELFIAQLLHRLTARQAVL